MGQWPSRLQWNDEATASRTEQKGSSTPPPPLPHIAHDPVSELLPELLGHGLRRGRQAMEEW